MSCSVNFPDEICGRVDRMASMMVMRLVPTKIREGSTILGYSSKRATRTVRAMVRMVLESADVPFVFFLEGGYNVNALGENVKVTLKEMLKD